MSRLFGRSPDGQRLVTHVPHGKYQTSTPRRGGAFEREIARGFLRVPWMGRCFWRGSARFGADFKLDDRLIMDNLATHKVAGVGYAIEAVGAKLMYLPPYSPDFNPIENMWSKIKQILRRLDPRPTTQLFKAAPTAFDAITTTDCQGFFLHARYAI